ncbi:hypothetical protein SERLA73DRAFT_179173 [Serpula lacrymans var. lacrymans S7.3]|uniref:C3H1-type domain-containing protein n=2 Tax=Serpula lacrymans var. lacrymans TaxID=341189 RepID=F8PRH3_SERL3|nr:uncharacterized protein SERLADRAFT_464172 [Serpula lacrymans var. lacrymans S7.9]EGO01112.1 hypothetical protein SERLA73DRAFT_179173 [Serpula lacrymans var. lacrymans S7.3]EGO26768.1 hypothetical protein SERLADRAFT_464172 [Serpula lacrymans var. lacrymans S7.9]
MLVKRKYSRATGYCQNFILDQCALGEKCRYIHAVPLVFPSYSTSSPFDRAPAVFRWPIPLPLPFTSSTMPMAQQFPFLIQEQNNETPQRRTSPPQPVSAPSGPTNNKAPTTTPLDLVSDSALFRPLTWKMKPCRYYIKNKGWCPRGEFCNFIHDLALVHSSSEAHSHSLADKETEIARPHENDNKLNARTISGGVRVGSQPTHCWAFVQGHCRHTACPYLHPEDIEPYMAYTPCPEWPTCTRVSCPFRHPIPTRPPGHVFPVCAPSLYGFPPSVPGSGHNTALPYGAYEVNGTTYFPIDTSTDINPPVVYNQAALSDDMYPLSDHYNNHYGAMHPQWGWSEISLQDLSQVEADSNTMTRPRADVMNAGPDGLLSLRDDEYAYSNTHTNQPLDTLSILSPVGKVEDLLENVFSKL